MKTFRFFGVSAVVIASACLMGGAMAQELTRAQVIGELHAAQAAGIVPHGDLDITARNGGPDDAPARTAKVTQTRAQVQAELAQAIKAGDMQQGDGGRTLAEIYPDRYPHPVPAPGLTRAVVRAQLAEALRVGDVQEGDTGRTLAEIYPDQYAAAQAQGNTRQANGDGKQSASTTHVASK